MKNYTTEQINEAYSLLNGIDTDNFVIKDYLAKLRIEVSKRDKSPFVKATDKYLQSLTKNDVDIRPMTSDDEYYVNGFWGMFEKKSGKLLRRHSDRGWLGGFKINL
jgi:hypothetical protein